MKRLNSRYHLAGAISIITFVIYITSLRNGFVNWDDPDYVIGNPFIRSFDLRFFKWAFFDFYAANWHPLTWISHALDYAVWGLDPLGHHLTNIVLHALNTFLVVILAVRLLASRQALKLTSAQISSVPANSSGVGTSRLTIHDSRFALIAAGMTGLLFGLHPLHVESVAWVSERKDLLCAFFYLLSILAYVSYRSYTTNKSYILSLALFILALLSKPMAVSLPVVLMILDWYPFERITSFKTFTISLKGKLPFMVLSIASSVITVLAQNASGAIRSMEIIPLQSRLIVAAKSLTTYLGKMMAPFNLIPLYTYPRNISPSSAEYLLPAILAAGITAACIIAVKKEKLWLSVWGFYVISLLPVLGIVQVGGQAMADRYTYLPGLGPLFIMGLVSAWCWEKLARLKKWSLVLKSAVAAAALILFASMTFMTIKQIAIWKNSIDLWSYVIEKEPAKVNFAYYMRGLVFQEQGQLDKAMEDYDMVNALEPFHFEVYYRQGSIMEKMGQPDKAIEDYSMAIAINPMAEEAFISRGILYAKAGLFGKALEDFNKAIELNYNYAGAYLNRGSLYLGNNDNEHAEADYRKACTLGSREGCEALQDLRLLKINREGH